MQFFEILLLASASCLDAMGTAISYRVSGIKFTVGSVAVMTFIHGAGMALSLFLSDAFLPFSPEVCVKLGAVFLIFMGIAGLMRASGQLDPDNDKKTGAKTLRAAEALTVSLGVATDAFVVGISTGPMLDTTEKILTATITLFVCLALIIFGITLGKGLGRVFGNRAWLSFAQGIFLMFMGGFMLITK